MQISLTSSCDFWCLFERAWATFFWKELEALAFVWAVKKIFFNYFYVLEDMVADPNGLLEFSL